MLYDISPPISDRTAVWPGDTPVSREVLMDLARGDNVTLSALRATVHLGAHADAPSHYGLKAPTIDEQPLDLYLGPCRLIRVLAGKRQRLGAGDLNAPIDAERILIATGNATDPNRFDTQFPALLPELVAHLRDQGVRLVGVDTPSVDLFDSTDLPTHAACLRLGMAILEGLVLDDVPPGRYELIALPLRLVGFDASPVRAVLRPLREAAEPIAPSPHAASGPQGRGGYP